MKKMLVLALALVFMLSGAVMAQYSGTFDDHFDVDLSSEFTEGDYIGYEDLDGSGLVYFNEVDSDNPASCRSLYSLFLRNEINR
jgi:hypothetical protein